MRHFCTYFDHHYLPRALALYDSLRRHGDAFRLWVLCLSPECESSLRQLALPELKLIPLETLEQHDLELLKVKPQRSRIEYYFTCSPSLPLFVLQADPAIDLLTYIDADLYFFRRPELVFAEIGERSIAITPHRFPAALRDRERYGIYNVGWVSWRRDSSGLECLQWWRERCLEWCFDREDKGRFADQKYLDQWPALFSNVAILEHPGINLAPWNLAGHKLGLEGEEILVDGRPLIFFHFHGLKQLSETLYDPQWSVYKIKPTKLIREKLYRPYLEALRARRSEMLKSIRAGEEARTESAAIKTRFNRWRGAWKGKYLRAPK
jgi:hypothetical protein